MPILITVEYPHVFLHLGGFSEARILDLLKRLEAAICGIANYDWGTQCIDVYMDDKDYLLDFAKCEFGCNRVIVKDIPTDYTFH